MTSRSAPSPHLALRVAPFNFDKQLRDILFVLGVKSLFACFLFGLIICQKYDK